VVIRVTPLGVYRNSVTVCAWLAGQEFAVQEKGSRRMYEKRTALSSRDLRCQVFLRFADIPSLCGHSFTFLRLAPESIRNVT
jgi:hypothetical protein